MLVQSLVTYAKTYLQEQLDEIAFERKPVHFEIVISPNGELVNEIKRVEEGGKKKGFMPMLIPRSPVNRNAGVHPMLACDAIQYVLGPVAGLWSKESQIERHQAYFEGFVQLLREAYAATGDEALAACVKLYERPDEVEKARAALIEEKAGGGTIIALSFQPEGFSRGGGPVILRPAVKEYWRKVYDRKSTDRHESAGKGYCMITGEYGPLAITHGPIKGTTGLGGQPSGVSLMSFDKPAFQSYNWSKNINSPVSISVANAYVLALNDLLMPGDHHPGWSKDLIIPTRKDYGSVAFLFWTRQPSDETLVGVLDKADPAEVRRLQDEAERILSSVKTGKAAVLDAVDENLFHLLAVSGNGGRLVVRDFFTASLARVKTNLSAWFDALKVTDFRNAGLPADPPKLSSILFQISTPGERKNKKYRELITTGLLRRALQGRPLGHSYLHKALGRMRVEFDNPKLMRAESGQPIWPVRVGFIRLCVNDLTREESLKMHEKLDNGQMRPAYVCGRLLAVYESIQFAASGDDLNVNITDRYFSMASTYPALAFPKMEQLARAHLKKLRRDKEKRPAFFALQRRLGDLMERIPNKGFPSQLSLEDQGRFVIGYHHQKAEDARSAAEAKERKKKETETTSEHE
jgi:CRISPR-associated protein Csd1